MDTEKPKRPKAARNQPKPVTTYRGMRLQPIVARSRFTDDEIRKAVEEAIAKNPDAFARKG